jgi:glycine/D-amino acid oxidase-like deaminating enzyme
MSFEAVTVDTLTRRGHKIETLATTSDFRKRFPAWKHDRVGYFNPVAGWARSGRVVEHLNRVAIASGVNIQYGSMNRLLLKPLSVAPVPSATSPGATSICEGIVTKDGQEIRAKTVIVAAGASTPMIVPQVSHMMWPTAQPVFHFEIEDPSQFPVEQFPVFFSSIAQTGFYGFPIIEEELSHKLAPRKALVAGPSSSEYLSPAKPQFRIKIGQHGPGWKLDAINDDSLSKLWAQVEAIEEKKIRNWLSAALPQISKARIVYNRLCIYCDTFDGDFLIDHIPEVSGLVVASGGSGHGFKFAPVLGSIIADVVENKPNKYKHRFAWRQVSLGRKESSRHLNLDHVPQSLASL